MHTDLNDISAMTALSYPPLTPLCLSAQPVIWQASLPVTASDCTGGRTRTDTASESYHTKGGETRCWCPREMWAPEIVSEQNNHVGVSRSTHPDSRPLVWLCKNNIMQKKQDRIKRDPKKTKCTSTLEQVVNLSVDCRERAVGSCDPHRSMERALEQKSRQRGWSNSKVTRASVTLLVWHVNHSCADASCCLGLQLPATLEKLKRPWLHNTADTRSPAKPLDGNNHECTQPVTHWFGAILRPRAPDTARQRDESWS